MKAVLLAGGFGTRLRPLTYTRPKPLLPVAGRPLMEWTMDNLPADVHEVTVAAGWHAERLRAYAAKVDRPFRLRVVEEGRPLLSGGAVANAVQGDAGDDPVLVLNGDIVGPMDLQSMVDQHGTRDAKATIATTPVPDRMAHQFGMVATGKDNIRIASFVEKPERPGDAPGSWANAGVFLLDGELVERLPERPMSLEKELFPTLLGDRFDAWRHEGPWIDVGDRERMLQAHRLLAPEANGMHRGSIIPDSADIAPDAVIEDSVLGEDVTVGPGARLNGCLVGDGEAIAGHHLDQAVWSRPVPAGFPA